jgi:hypothetical protein
LVVGIRPDEPFYITNRRFSYDAPVVTTVSKGSVGGDWDLTGKNFGGPVRTSGYCGDGTQCGTGIMFQGAPCHGCCCPTGCFPIKCPVPENPQRNELDGAINHQYTLTILLGATVCTTALWYSDSVVKCSIQPIAATDRVAVSVNGLVGTYQPKVIYDKPFLTAFNPPNAPATGMAAITIFGDRFSRGLSQASIGATSCVTTIWSSESMLQCIAPQSSSLAVPLTVRVGGSESADTVPRAISFDAPIVTAVAQRAFELRVASPGLILTISGSNFGAGPSIPTVQIGPDFCTLHPELQMYGTAAAPPFASQFMAGPGCPAVLVGRTLCRSVAWVSDSSISCVVPPSGGAESRIAFYASFTLYHRFARFHDDAGVTIGPCLSNGLGCWNVARCHVVRCMLCVAL